MSTNPEKSISYILSKPVSKYMNNDVLTLDQDTLTRDAVRTLQHYDSDDIVVVDKNKIAVGIVTDEDILEKVSDATVNAEATRLRDVMTKPVITVYEKTTLQEALHLMRDNRIKKLPVLSKKNFVVGMIFQKKISDVIKEATVITPRLLSPPVKAVLGNLGFVLQFAGVLLLAPALLSTVLGETITATGIYLTMVLLLVTGFFLNSYGEKAALNLQQASILVFASLFLLSLFGTIPYLYVAPADATGIEVFADAFFSSAAGFTTGGISLYDEPENLPQSFTFYRSFTQLVGGMSFIYLVMTAFYPESKLQSMRGFISGKTLHMKELFGTITIIFTVYIVIVAVLLFFLGERNMIDNISLSMSTLATGGFTPTSTILDGLEWREHLVLMGAMILGALPFTFHYAFVRKKFLSPKLGNEVLVYFSILVFATLLFVWLSGLDLLEGAFYSISASTTAGLQYENLSGLDSAARVVLIILMFVGGCGFSTAGGFKVFRLFHLKDCMKIFKSASRKSLDIRDRNEIITTILIISLFPAIAAITAGQLAVTENASYEDAFFESVGVITTGGLSSGVIDFETDPATKIVLSFLMIFGRLEIIAIIYIFVPKLI